MIWRKSNGPASALQHIRFFSRPGSGGDLLCFAFWLGILIVKIRTWSGRITGLAALGLIMGIVWAGSGVYSRGELAWKSYSESEIKQAMADHRPVMIEFTADWCLNCKVLEQTVLKSREIAAAVEMTGMISLRVDITRVSEENKQLLIRYKGYALPYLVLVDQNGTISHRLTGIFKAKTLADAIIKTGESV